MLNRASAMSNHFDLTLPKFNYTEHTLADNFEDRNMGNVISEAFIALPSLPGDWPNEILLLDAKWLAFHHEIKGPITIAKTKFTIDNGLGWRALIADGSNNFVLVSSDELDSTDSYVDLIDLLGHRLIVMPWQSLIIQLDGPAIIQGACFIEYITR